MDEGDTESLSSVEHFEEAKHKKYIPSDETKEIGHDQSNENHVDEEDTESLSSFEHFEEAEHEDYIPSDGTNENDDSEDASYIEDDDINDDLLKSNSFSVAKDRNTTETKRIGKKIVT